MKKLFRPKNEYYEKNIHYTDEFKRNTETVEGLIESKPLEDDIRRFESYKELIKGSEILDFGCGRGGFIQLSNKISNRSVGVELNIKNIDTLKNPNRLTEKNKLIGLEVSQNEINDHTKMLQKLQKNVWGL